MAVVTVAEAAKHIGHRSTSQLYRMINKGLLRNYVRTALNGQLMLELEPPGLRPLARQVAGLTQWRRNNVARR